MDTSSILFILRALQCANVQMLCEQMLRRVSIINEHILEFRARTPHIAHALACARPCF
jgi:hypothetical protein